MKSKQGVVGFSSLQLGGSTGDDLGLELVGRGTDTFVRLSIYLVGSDTISRLGQN